MEKKIRKPVRKLYLNENCEIISELSDEEIVYILRFLYQDGKVSAIKFFDLKGNLICTVFKKQICKIDLKNLQKCNIQTLKDNLSKKDMQSKSFKENLIKLFFYNKFFQT